MELIIAKHKSDFRPNAPSGEEDNFCLPHLLVWVISCFFIPELTSICSISLPLRRCLAAQGTWELTVDIALEANEGTWKHPVLLPLSSTPPRAHPLLSTSVDPKPCCL